LLVTVQNFLGWRGLFISSGIVGIAWAVVWYAFYRDPHNHKRVSAGELRLIEEGGGLIQNHHKSKEKQKISRSDLLEAFRHRKLWGVYIGQFCMGTVTIFFLTWFPTYLVDYRGLDFLQSGFLASVPFLAAFAGVLSSGFVSDLLIKKGYSKELARKAPVLTGLLLSISIIGANFTDQTAFVILFLAIAFLGNGFASIGWVFISLMAPKHLIGVVGGVFNFVGGLSAIVVPVVIGFLVQEGDFAPALYFIGAATLIGFFSYLFIVGKIVRIEVRN
jgi:ACS family D-galactonate transporter-like MFS transporter